MPKAENPASQPPPKQYDLENLTEDEKIEIGQMLIGVIHHRCSYRQAPPLSPSPVFDLLSRFAKKYVQLFLRLAQGDSVKQFAESFGCSIAVINSINTKIIWAIIHEVEGDTTAIDRAITKLEESEKKRESKDKVLSFLKNFVKKDLLSAEVINKLIHSIAPPPRGTSEASLSGKTLTVEEYTHVNEVLNTNLKPETAQDYFDFVKSLYRLSAGRLVDPNSFVQLSIFDIVIELKVKLLLSYPSLFNNDENAEGGGSGNPLSEG